MSGISWLEKGVLSVITGPMFSGKTEELIKRINILKRVGKKVLVFNIIFDKRYGIRKQIISHNKSKVDSFLISNLNDLKKILNENKVFDAIAFDETQFLPISFFPIIKKLLIEDKIVICAGLDKDYFNQYSSLLAHLLVYADVVDKYFSICLKCNNIATHTQRLINSKIVDYNKPKILIGSFKNYEPRCKKCFKEFDKNKYE